MGHRPVTAVSEEDSVEIPSIPVEEDKPSPISGKRNALG